MPASTSGRTAQQHPMPFTRVEIAVLSVIDDSLHVLLARRAEAPHAGKWALPGGALRIDLDRSLEAAAARVMQERLGLASRFLRQIGAVGGPGRDARSPWALSVIYRALLQAGQAQPAPGKRIEALEWRPVEKAASDKALAFDHAALIAQAVETTRAEVDRLDLPAGFLPERFTLTELQNLCAQLLGRRLDKSSFRRRLAERGNVEPVDGETRGGAFRPAQLYRYVPSRDA